MALVLTRKLIRKFYVYHIYAQIIKLKRQALVDTDSYDHENSVNKQIEEDLYQDAISKLPELRSMDKEEVLRQMKTAAVTKNSVKQDDEDIPTRKIFIDHVLCNDAKFNDAEVRDHVYTIVAAGSETTALQTAHTSELFMQIACYLHEDQFVFP